MNQYIRQPVAPPADVAYAHKLGRGMLLPEQVMELVKAINPAFVEKKQNTSYLAQHQARAEMNRIFGYGNWSSKVVYMNCDYEERLEPGHPSFPKTGKAPVYWIAGYQGAVLVEIRDLWGMPIAEYLEHHFEENAPQPNRGEARALALTSVESYALRRSLINLGDRLGLGLYNRGSMNPHGQYTIQLQAGILSQWVEPGQQQAPAAPAATPIQQPTHETLQAEQAEWEAGISDEPSDYDDGSPEQQVAVQKRAARNQSRFTQARQQVQEGNMRARLQAGMKQDAAQEAEHQRYERENDYANEIAAQQARGGVIG